MAGEPQKLSPYEYLAVYRLRAGLTQQELAGLVGLKSYQSISDWESGQSLPRPKTLQRLIELYHFKSVFQPDQELQEVINLWTSIKDMFDLSGSICRLYPPFDRSWFDSLLQLSFRVMASSELSADKLEKTKPSEQNSIENDIISNLCYQPVQLIGRESEIERLLKVLKEPNTRLVTLVGPPGIGKTCLSLEMAYQLLPFFKDGIRFINLSSIRDPLQVPQAVAKALKLEGAQDVLITRLKEYLSQRDLLLVLDNFEQVLEATGLILELLETAHRLKVLVTSREILHLSGEHVYELASLVVPDLKNDLSLLKIAGYGAVNLFVQRAETALPGFKLTTENMVTVVNICSRLDGIPLALELIAAQLKILSLSDLQKLLDSNMLAINGGLGGGTGRHYTMWAAIDWSYQLLESAEQQLFQIASLFPGGFTLEQISEIYTQFKTKKLEEIAIYILLKGLVSKSLIRREPLGESRFNLLETIRDYALERLKESGEFVKVQAIFASYILEFIKATVTREKLGTVRGRSIVEQEYRNILAALDWSIMQKQSVLALKFTAALGLFWSREANYSEGERYLDMALALPLEENNRLERGWATYHASELAWRQGNFEKGKRLATESFKIFCTYKEHSGIAYSIETLGIIAYRLGDYEKARADLEESLSLFRNLEDKWGIVRITGSLGHVFYNQGDVPSTRHYWEETLLLAQKLGDPLAIINSLTDLAILHCHQGNFQLARKYALENLEIVCESGNFYQKGYLYDVLAEIEYNEKNYEESLKYAKETFRLAKEKGYKLGISAAYGSLGLIYLAQKNYRSARQCLEKALLVNKELGVKRQISYTLNNLGLLALKQGNLTLATKYQRESLLIEAELNDSYGIPFNLTVQAALSTELNFQQGKVMPNLFVRAAVLAGVIAALLERNLAVLDTLYQEIYDEVIITLKETMPIESYKNAYARGNRMSLREALTFSLENF